MLEDLLVMGMFLVLCGIFVLCLTAVAVIVLTGMSCRRNEEGQKMAFAVEESGAGKMDSALLKQWNNLLGYNGDEGDDIDG